MGVNTFWHNLSVNEIFIGFKKSQEKIWKNSYRYLFKSGFIAFVGNLNGWGDGHFSGKISKNYNLINKNAFHLELNKYDCRTFRPKTLNYELWDWKIGDWSLGLTFEKSGVKMSCNSEMVYIFKEEIPITNELKILKNISKITNLSIWSFSMSTAFRRFL